MIEEKSKLNQTFVKVINFFFIIVSVLGIIYYLWMHYRIPLVFYISSYRNTSYIGALVFYTSYVFIILIGYFSQISVRSLRSSKVGILSAVLFVVTTLLCCMSSAILPSLPRVLDKIELSNTIYYLTGELEVIDSSHAFSRLYKCNKTTYQCEQTIFFDTGGAGFNDLHLMIDKASNPNEVNVIYIDYRGFEYLEFTYGTQPRYYDVPAQLNDHLYYLAYYRNPEPNSTTFLLYECELDNTSCKQLPFQYKGFGVFTDTIANEATGEINIFIDDQMSQDTLIFTWGENPRCYVEKCEILENLK